MVISDRQQIGTLDNVDRKQFLAKLEDVEFFSFRSVE